MAAIEHRQRQQIQHTQTDADQRQKCKVLCQADLGRFARVFGNRQRPADVLQRSLTDHHLAHHLERERRHFPGLLRALAQAFPQAVAHLLHGYRRANKGAEAANLLPAVFGLRQLHGHMDARTGTLDQPVLQRRAAFGARGADHAAQMAAVAHGHAVDLQHHITLAQPGL